MKSNPVYFSAKTILGMLEDITNQSVAFSSFHADGIFNVLLVILLPWVNALGRRYTFICITNVSQP